MKTPGAFTAASRVSCSAGAVHSYGDCPSPIIRASLKLSPHVFSYFPADQFKETVAQSRSQANPTEQNLKARVGTQVIESPP